MHLRWDTLATGNLICAVSKRHISCLTHSHSNILILFALWWCSYFIFLHYIDSKLRTIFQFSFFLNFKTFLWFDISKIACFLKFLMNNHFAGYLTPYSHFIHKFKYIYICVIYIHPYMQIIIYILDTHTHIHIYLDISINK